MSARTSNSPRTDAPSEPLLTIEEVAARLGVGVRHVRRLVHERRIPFVKWGHLVRFDPDEVAAWLEGARVPVVDPVR
jgi:excisionase family DNA binding protein